MSGLSRPGTQRRDIERAMAQIEDGLLQDTGIGHEVRGGMAAVGQLDVDDLGMAPIEFPHALHRGRADRKRHRPWQ